ncbi:MAG: hypothetical protein ACI4XL_09140 [Bacillus sp. (in: firmicutes)]
MQGFKKVTLAAVTVGILITSAACKNEETGKANSSQLEGNVVIDGSSTVYPIMEAISEEYSLM